MARPGVTYAEVARAATQLIAQQIRPSIEAVRRILGTGSNSTINRHLREWHKTQGVQAELEQGLPDTLLIAVRGVYDGMREQANQQLTEIKAEKNSKISELHEQIKILETEKTQSNREKLDFQQTINETEQERSALSRQLEHQLKENEKHKADNHLLTERLNDKQSEVDQLNELLKHTQSNLDHYRDTICQERLNDKQDFEAKIAALEGQRQLQQKQTTAAKEEIARLTQCVKSLETNQKIIEQSEKKLLEKERQKEYELQSLQSKIAELQQTCDQLLLEKQTLTQTVSSDKTTINDLTIKTEKQNERIELQKMALQKAEGSLQNLSDKHLILTQTNAELNYQLKYIREMS